MDTLVSIGRFSQQTYPSVPKGRGNSIGTAYGTTKAKPTQCEGGGKCFGLTRCFAWLFVCAFSARRGRGVFYGRTLLVRRVGGPALRRRAYVCCTRVRDRLLVPQPLLRVVHLP